MLYFLNALAQFIITDLLLSNGNLSVYGVTLVRDLLSGRTPESIFFPRQTLCDFYVRELGLEIIGTRHTVQCVLSINLFLQAIFSFYWFWLLLVLLYNLSNTFHWMVHLCSKSNSRSYVLKHIRQELLLNSNPDKCCRNDPQINKFIDQYLQTDGIFVLRLISRNISDIVMTDLTSALYENFKIMESVSNLESSFSFAKNV
ncbi:innexin-11-like [Octopus sinensis]|uniref:Innexin n=1 Tax=Octopus sinensis TaxID=2607531 RepID=A0A7E6EMN8_9MOLL|nr:innexin-11-like [Octopus sinensis]